MRNSPLRAFINDNKKKNKRIKKGSQEIQRTKNVDEQIERGDAPKPDTKKMLKHYLYYIHDRRIV